MTVLTQSVTQIPPRGSGTPTPSHDITPTIESEYGTGVDREERGEESAVLQLPGVIPSHFPRDYGGRETQGILRLCLRKVRGRFDCV